MIWSGKKQQLARLWNLTFARNSRAHGSYGPRGRWRALQLSMFISLVNGLLPEVTTRNNISKSALAWRPAGRVLRSLLSWLKQWELANHVHLHLFCKCRCRTWAGLTTCMVSSSFPSAAKATSKVAFPATTRGMEPTPMPTRATTTMAWEAIGSTQISIEPPPRCCWRPINDAHERSLKPLVRACQGKQRPSRDCCCACFLATILYTTLLSGWPGCVLGRLAAE